MKAMVPERNVAFHDGNNRLLVAARISLIHETSTILVGSLPYLRSIPLYGITEGNFRLYS